MIRFLLVIGLMLHPLTSLAADYPLAADRNISFTLPSARWQVSSDPPESAIQAMMDDIAYETEKKGQKVDRTILREKAIEYARTNNLFVHDPMTDAYLMISISKAEKTPKAATVKSSAEWTMNEILENAELEGTGGYERSLKKVELSGLPVAYRIEANYPLHHAPHNFIGIIGFGEPYWVFLYYNDKAQDPDDLREMRLLLDSVSLSAP